MVPLILWRWRPVSFFCNKMSVCSTKEHSITQSIQTGSWITNTAKWLSKFCTNFDSWGVQMCGFLFVLRYWIGRMWNKRRSKTSDIMNHMVQCLWLKQHGEGYHEEDTITLDSHPFGCDESRTRIHDTATPFLPFHYAVLANASLSILIYS